MQWSWMQRIFLGKKSVSFFAPIPWSYRLPFFKKNFPAGALLLCLILAKAYGHSRLCYTSHLLFSNMNTEHWVIQTTRHEHTWIEHLDRPVHQILEKTLDKNTKRAENFCCRAQRKQSRAPLKFLSASGTFSSCLMRPSAWLLNPFY